MNAVVETDLTYGAAEGAVDFSKVSVQAGAFVSQPELAKVTVQSLPLSSVHVMRPRWFVE